MREENATTDPTFSVIFVSVTHYVGSKRKSQICEKSLPYISKNLGDQGKILVFHVVCKPCLSTETVTTSYN